jgi:hypothetical protein
MAPTACFNCKALPPLVESVFSGFFHLRFIRTISFTEVKFRFGQYTSPIQSLGNCHDHCVHTYLYSNRQDSCFCLGYYILEPATNPITLGLSNINPHQGILDGKMHYQMQCEDKEYPKTVVVANLDSLLPGDSIAYNILVNTSPIQSLGNCHDHCVHTYISFTEVKFRFGQYYANYANGCNGFKVHGRS